MRILSEKKAKGLRIISKVEGFRRCGIEHTTTPKTYPCTKFTEQQIKQLKADKMLIVDEVEYEEKKDDKESKT